MFTLYYSPGVCSLAVHVLLREVGAEFNLKEINLAKGENRTPEFLAINPRGSVPVLMEDDRVMREGAAIMQALAERYSSPLLPGAGAEREEALEWLAFANATLHPAYSRAFFLKRNKGTEEQLNTCYRNIQNLWDEMDKRLDSWPYIAGKEITLADILITVISRWSETYLSGNITYGKHVSRLLNEVSSRPHFQEAMKAEGLV